MKKFIVNKNNDGKKLNNVVLNEFSGLNINTMYKALRKKDIRVNGVKVSTNIIVYEGDEITVFIQDDLLYNNPIKLNDIVYEDDNIIVVDKPAELEITGTKQSLTEHLINLFGYEVFPCHRLDRNTSGLVIFAKDIETREILFEKFKAHEIEKHYLCVVYGIPANSHAILEAYLFKDNKNARVYIKDSYEKGYQKIKTEYKIISVDKEKNTCILDVTLHTGKTHQIRAHLAHIGHPILGDGKYGKNEINKKFGLKYQKLYSYSLEFKFSTPSGKLEYLNNKKIDIPVKI